MENKSYKKIFIERKTLKYDNKIYTLKEGLKVNKNNFEEYADSWRTKEDLTNTQYNELKAGNLTKFKQLVRKQIIKEQEKKRQATEEAQKEYNKIKELKDIKNLTIEIEWSAGRGAYGYQTRAIANITYKNGDFKHYETSYTGGCGYDKPSTSLSEVCNALCKIVFIKHYDKKIKNDIDKHYKFYAGEDGSFSYGVGMTSYRSFFENLKYKVNYIYHNNENITMIIEK